MAYILSGSTIRAPKQLRETNSTLVAQQRTLQGTVNRDYFGSNKRIWILNYRNTKKTDYDTIKAIHTAYLATGAAVTWQSTEPNYTFASTSVHVDVQERNFSIRGTDYISDFDLILTEA